MTDPIRYRDVMARALEHESKDHRNDVLSSYPGRVQVIVRAGMMKGLAKRHAAKVRHAGASLARWDGRYAHSLTVDERRGCRRAALAAIEPKWLRDRVEAMVREQFAWVNEQREQMRAALG